MTIPFLALGWLFLSPLSQDAGAAPTSGRVSQATWLLRSADTNGDGEVARSEWDTFTAGLPRDQGVFDRGVVFARGLTSLLDGDGDRVIERADMERIRSTLDANADGAIEASERPRRGSGALGSEDRFLAQIALAAADDNQDGACSEAEWEALFGDLQEGALPWEQLAVWVRLAARATDDGDRNAMGMSVVLVGYDADLDLDQDGRLSDADLEGHFSSLDSDGNGVVDAGELSPRTTFDPSGWQVSEAGRAALPLMPWQRNLDDALALVEQTGKPLLVCVNMDGESASEKLAIDKYRDPSFLELAAGFIPVITSPDRRNPRDHDDRGRRIPDPRFGRIVNSEAIDIDPELFQRYFSGQRVAPRHVGVAPDGTILFDLYLLQDLGVIDAKLAEHGVAGEIPPAASLSEAELLASPDATHRDALEAAFSAADVGDRARLAAQAFSAQRPTQHPELARMALLDPADEVRAAVLACITARPDAVPLDLFVSACGASRGDPAQRAVVLDALDRRAASLQDEAKVQRARRLALALRGLSSPSTRFDVARWELGYRLAPVCADDALDDFDATVELLEKTLRASGAAPEDLELGVLATRAQMRFAEVTLARGGNPLFAFEDVLASARRTLAIDPDNGSALGYLARGNYMLGRLEEAASAAESALPRLVQEANSKVALDVLDAFVQPRLRAIYDAVGAAQVWPAEWLPDLHAALEIQMLHPLRSEAQLTAYLDLLGSLEAYGEQLDLARRQLEREPLSATVHNYLRYCVLRDLGAEALVRTYAEFASSGPEAELATREWFAGLAAFMAAEQHVRNGRPAEALGAYGSSVAYFDSSVAREESFAGTAYHYVSLALASRARLNMEADSLAQAVEALIEGIGVSPASAEAQDGLGYSPAAIARNLRARLGREGLDELREQLDQEMALHGVAGFERAPEAPPGSRPPDAPAQRSGLR